MKPENKPIFIACYALSRKEERHRVNASVVGEIAIHRGLTRIEGKLIPTDDWVVTHIRTGLAIRKYLTYRQARRLLSDLQGFNWKFGRFGRSGDSRAFNDTRSKAREIVEAV